MTYHPQRSPAYLAALGTAACALLAGCGGGGGTVNRTLSGTLQDQSKQGLTGYRIVFDSPSQYATTTEAGGVFRLVVPTSSLTGHDTFSIYDPSGALADVETVQVNSGGINVYTLPPLGPPTQPGNL